MADGDIEGGVSDALIEHVATRIRVHAGTKLGVQTWDAATFVVGRLRAGGISDMVIRKCLCGDGFAEAPAPDTLAPFRDRDLP